MQARLLVGATDVRTGLDRQEGDTAEPISRYDERLIRTGVERIAVARANLAMANARRAAAQMLLAESARICEREVAIDAIAWAVG